VVIEIIGPADHPTEAGCVARPFTAPNVRLLTLITPAPPFAGEKLKTAAQALSATDGSRSS
jgi:hypothetical protein